MKPFVIDLFCGLGGWSKGFIDEGYDAYGFDIERHQYGDRRYPGQLVLQDARTLHGSQFRNAAAIVASPPCQEYSYMAMPWSRGKQIAGALRDEVPFPHEYTGSRTVTELTELFDTCFRLQREASEAAGRRIPLVVENVKGAQPWVGMAKAHFGSFYLWGDVESVGGQIVGMVPRFGDTLRPAKRNKRDGRNFHAFENGLGSSPSFNGADHEVRGTAVLEREGVKQRGSGAVWSDKAVDERRKEATAIENGGDWFGSGADASEQRRHNSKSDSRKAASAMIAEIPCDLARYIARILKKGGC